MCRSLKEWVSWQISSFYWLIENPSKPKLLYMVNEAFPNTTYTSLPRHLQLFHPFCPELSVLFLCLCKFFSVGCSCLPPLVNLANSCCWVSKSCPTLRPRGLQNARLLCAPRSPQFAQTHVHWVGVLSNHPIPCCPLLLLPSIFPSIRVFSSESALHIRWPKCWSFSISPFNEHSGLISLTIQLSKPSSSSAYHRWSTIALVPRSSLSFLIFLLTILKPLFTLVVTVCYCYYCLPC